MIAGPISADHLALLAACPLCFTLFIVVVTGLILSHPDYEMTPLVTAATATAVLVPLAFYPSAKTTWTATDILMRPLTQGEANPPTQPTTKHKIQ